MIYRFCILVFSLLYFGCINKKDITLNDQYNPKSFSTDFKQLLKDTEIDSILYLKGLVLQRYATNSQEWQELSYGEIVIWIKNNIREWGYTDNQNFKDEYLSIISRKICDSLNNVNYFIEIGKPEKFNYEEGDEIILVVNHDNLLGQFEFGEEIKFTLGVESNENEILFNYTSETEIEKYKRNLPSWKFDNLQILSDSDYCKYSRIWFTKYIIKRNGIVLNEFDITKS